MQMLFGRFVAVLWERAQVALRCTYVARAAPDAATHLATPRHAALHRGMFA